MRETGSVPRAGAPEAGRRVPTSQAARVIRLAAFSCVFVAASYAPYWAPRDAVNLSTLTVFWTFYCSTAIILLDETTSILESRSLLIEVTSTGRRLGGFAAVGAGSGLLLGGPEARFTWS